MTTGRLDVDVVPAQPKAGSVTALRPLGLDAVGISHGFWAARQATNRAAAISRGHDRLVAAGNLDNLAMAARRQPAGRYRGPVFMDSDVYKWLEAVAWECRRSPSPQLRAQFDEVVALIADAQQDDGYLNSYVQVTGASRYGDLAFGHELYCYGHLFQAAVAARRSLGDEILWQVALAAADQVVSTFGPGGNPGVPGHPLIEMALVEMARESGREAYAETARVFVERRGQNTLRSTGREPSYFSDRVPVREASTVEGHAVRAVYLAAGATDVVLEGLADSDHGYLDALRGQWQHMVETKAYVTGGLGSQWDGEAFGGPYELPPDVSYCETCAAIGSVQWSWRLLLATGDARYADLIERTLFNAMLAGVSLAGDEFFYVNPLQLRDGAGSDDHRHPANGRSGWFDVACCPPNVMRTLASLAGYFATGDDRGVQLHQYATGTVSAPGGAVQLAITTDYPWDGTVDVLVEESRDGAWELALRVPAWCTDASVSVNGETSAAAPGYWRATREWSAGDRVVLQLPMPVRLTVAHPRVDAVRGCAAVERGPLVYCIEAAGSPASAPVDDVELVGVHDARWDGELLGGVAAIAVDTVVRRSGPQLYAGPSAAPSSTSPADPVVTLTAIPYFAWANRGVGPMRVWLPTHAGEAG